MISNNYAYEYFKKGTVCENDRKYGEALKWYLKAYKEGHEEMSETFLRFRLRPENVYEIVSVLAKYVDELD